MHHPVPWTQGIAQDLPERLHHLCIALLKAKQDSCQCGLLLGRRFGLKPKVLPEFFPAPLNSQNPHPLRRWWNRLLLLTHIPFLLRPNKLEYHRNGPNLAVPNPAGLDLDPIIGIETPDPLRNRLNLIPVFPNVNSPNRNRSHITSPPMWFPQHHYCSKFALLLGHQAAHKSAPMNKCSVGGPLCSELLPALPRVGNPLGIIHLVNSRHIHSLI